MSNDEDVQAFTDRWVPAALWGLALGIVLMLAGGALIGFNQHRDPMIALTMFTAVPLVLFLLKQWRDRDFYLDKIMRICIMTAIVPAVFQLSTMIAGAF